MNLGFYSYSVAAAAFGFFSLLLLFSWRQSLQARLLVVVMLVNTLWALLAANLTVGDNGNYAWAGYRFAEVARYVTWFWFLSSLFAPVAGAPSSPAEASTFRGRRQWLLTSSVLFALLIWLNESMRLLDSDVVNDVGHLLLALIAIAMLEQIYRNASVRHRWAIKYLVIGAACFFVFDFYMYTDGLLYKGLDRTLWQARGFVSLFAIPLLAISAVRSRNWSLNLFVSRDVVLNSTTIMVGGAYLMVVSAGSYYLREFGGSWGQLWQTVFFSLALVLLALLLLSGQLRARVRVFLGKHFYRNKYDYRLEWLRLTEELSDERERRNPYAAVIKPIAQIIEARSGLLWLPESDQDGAGADFRPVASWQNVPLEALEPAQSDFLRFLSGKGYIVNLHDVASRPDEYGGLVLPDWLQQINDPWVIVPLFDSAELSGFLVLAQPLVERTLNWEDRDLLKTAARQVASHLRVLKTSAALAQSKQFEVFTRLSAYMVHDLKNIAAELELISVNARKHAGNQAFVEDAFETVEHAATDIKRLLEQLRNRKARMEKKVRIDIATLIREVVQGRQKLRPYPQFIESPVACEVTAESGQLRNVLAHLVENAQQATEDDGRVEIRLRYEDGFCVIDICDTGQGMTPAFIRERLFKPFDTTKGNAGMGIGMYESRDFVTALGGRIEVKSEVGEGTVVSIFLPGAKNAK